MKNRIAALLLGAVFALSTSVFAAPSDWAKAEVGQAEALGFVPYELREAYQEPITRYEFVLLALAFFDGQYGFELEGRGDVDVTRAARARDAVQSKLSGEERQLAYGAAENPFSDMGRADDGYRQAAQYNVYVAHRLGLIDGYEDGTFRPDNSMTRQEAAKLLLNTYLAYSGGYDWEPSEPTYTDLDEIGDWAREPVALLRDWDVMRGVGGGAFDPQGSYTREQAILTFLRLYQNAPVSRAKSNVPYAHEAMVWYTVTDPGGAGVLSSTVYAQLPLENGTVFYYGVGGLPRGSEAYFRFIGRDGSTADLLAGIPKPDFYAHNPTVDELTLWSAEDGAPRYLTFTARFDRYGEGENEPSRWIVELPALNVTERGDRDLAAEGLTGKTIPIEQH